MLKANELWAMCNGSYPETDYVWIKDLCYNILVVIEDISWQQLPAEKKEAQELLCFMDLCKLNAVLV